MSGSRDRALSGDAAARRSGADLTPFRAIAESVTADGGELVEQVSALIEQAQAFAAAQVDATLTLRNWYIGRLIDVAVLREGRAGHAQELVASLAQQLTSRYGRGYDRTNLYRMVRFSQQFSESELVASLAQQVSWTHFRELFPLATDDARAFYVREIIDRHLSVRDLRYAISRKAFERREIADSQIPEGSAVPLDAFRDPVLLDMLGLADTYLERDIESALRHDMEAFLLEVGRGCCSNSTRTASWWLSIGRPSHPRLSSRPVSRRSTERRRSGSRGGSSPQRRKKTSMSRDWRARDAASSAASSGF